MEATANSGMLVYMVGKLDNSETIVGEVCDEFQKKKNIVVAALVVHESLRLGCSMLPQHLL
jgi:hypothetical protein